MPVFPSEVGPQRYRPDMTDMSDRMIPLDQAALEIAARLKACDSYVITLPPKAFSCAVQRVGKLFGSVIYADNGTDVALKVPGPGIGEALAAVANVIGEFLTGVAVVPKTVPRGLLSRALGRKLPEDQSQDIVLIESTGEHRYIWPTLFVVAMDQVDAEYAAAIRAAAVPGGTVAREPECIPRD